MRSVYIWLGLLWGLLTVPSLVIAQADYQGLRLAVFGFETLRQNNSRITLRCQVANTGRLPVALQGKPLLFPPLVIELDTLQLPEVLRGQPALVERAVQQERMRLAPGEIRAELVLTINLRDTLPAVALPVCADLVLDTAYLVRQEEQRLTVWFQLRNMGAYPARLFAGNTGVVLNTYFVSGTKLTRGAILAEQIPLRVPRELANGILPAGKSVHWQVEVSTKNRTRFSPHLALEFDPLQTVPDCGAGKRVWVIGE